MGCDLGIGVFKNFPVIQHDQGLKTDSNLILPFSYFSTKLVHVFHIECISLIYILFLLLKNGLPILLEHDMKLARY